jgi:uncharacterized protein
MAADSLWTYAALVVAGIGAGFLNTVAGGGSMLTLPVLMLLGLPADVANGTNRVAIVSQSLAGVLSFRRGGVLDQPAVVPMLVPTVAGAVIGAAAASRVPAPVLKLVLLGTMTIMAAVMLVRPHAIGGSPGGVPRRLTSSRLGILGLFAAGLYGGFVQAGVGFVLLAVLGGVLRYDLAAANALKLACTLVLSGVALVVFVAADQVRWAPGLALAACTVVGSQLGVRFALRVPQKVLRAAVFVAVVATCAGAALKG